MKDSEDNKEILYHADDKLLKVFFSRADNMREFLQSNFPKLLTEQMRWSCLNKQNGNFVDDSMRSIETDMLYRIALKNGKDAFIYCLIESQKRSTKNERWMRLRLLRYMCGVWNEYLQQHNNAQYLPLIFPLVFYHGKGRWEHSLEFGELFDLSDTFPEQLQNCIPTFSHHLCEISQMPYEERQKYSDWALVHTFLKAESEKNLSGMLKSILKILFLSDRASEVLLKTLYCLFNSSQLDNKIIFDEVEKISDTNIKIGEKIMSAATELRAEGRVEGLMEGEQKVLIETVQHLQGILKCAVDTTEELTVKSLEELRVQRDLLECEIAKKLSS